MKTEIITGWGLRVGWRRPYLARGLWFFKEQVKCTKPYHKAIRVAVVPLQEYKRLLRLEKKGAGE